MSRSQQPAALRSRICASNPATWSMVELIESAARTGQADRAAGALQRLTETASAAGTDWALGVLARSRAVLSEDESADYDDDERFDENIVSHRW